LGHLDDLAEGRIVRLLNSSGCARKRREEITMVDASVVGIFETASEAEAAKDQLTQGGIEASQISVFVSSLRGTWTVRGYVRSGTTVPQDGRYLAVVKGDAAKITEAAQILRAGGATHVDSLATLVREFLRATPPQAER